MPSSPVSGQRPTNGGSTGWKSGSICLSAPAAAPLGPDRCPLGARTLHLPARSCSCACVGLSATIGSARFKSGRGAAWSARLFWVQEVVGSNPAAPTTRNGDSIHAGPHLPAAEERHAIRLGQHARVGLGVPSHLAPTAGPADGLD